MVKGRERSVLFRYGPVDAGGDLSIKVAARDPNGWHRKDLPVGVTTAPPTGRSPKARSRHRTSLPVRDPKRFPTGVHGSRSVSTGRITASAPVCIGFDPRTRITDL